MYSILRRAIDNSIADKHRVPSVQERMQISHDIFKLDSIELAAVLTLIEKQCPNALTRRAAYDEALLNLDALTPICYHEVNTMILTFLLDRNGGKNKGKRKGVEGVPGEPSSSSSGKVERGGKKIKS